MANYGPNHQVLRPTFSFVATFQVVKKFLDKCMLVCVTDSGHIPGISDGGGKTGRADLRSTATAAVLMERGNGLTAAP